MNMTTLNHRIALIIGHLQAAKDDANENGVEDAAAFLGIAQADLGTLVAELRDIDARKAG